MSKPQWTPESRYHRDQSLVENANADIISSAPELYDALEIAKHIIDSYVRNPKIDGYAEIEAALQKARGEI